MSNINSDKIDTDQESWISEYDQWIRNAMEWVRGTNDPFKDGKVSIIIQTIFMTSVIIGLIYLTLNKKLKFIIDPQLNKYCNTLNKNILLTTYAFLISYLLVYSTHTLYMLIIYFLDPTGEHRSDDKGIQDIMSFFCIMLSIFH